MARQKIEFSEDVIARIVELVKDNKSVREIQEELLRVFNFKVGKDSLRLQIKSLGLEKTDARKNNKKETTYDFKPEDVLKHLAVYKNEKEIAEILNTSPTTVTRFMKKENITNERVREYRKEEFYNTADMVDLRTLKDEVYQKFIDELISVVRDRTTIIPNAVVEYKGKRFVVDVYCPEIKHAYVCGTIDDLISKPKSERLGIAEINVWKKYVNNNCEIHTQTNSRKCETKRYVDVFEEDNAVSYNTNFEPVSRDYSFNGLYIDKYAMKANYEKRVYEVIETARMVANEIFSLITEGKKNVKVVNVDDVLYEKRNYFKEMMDEDVKSFDKSMKEMMKRDRENCKKEEGGKNSKPIYKKKY